MKALTLKGKGFDHLVVEEIPIPEPGDGQLLARVDCAGICTSLLKIISQGSTHPMMYGWNLETTPAILGDEGSVTLVEVGKNLRHLFQEDDRYVVQPSINHPPIYRRQMYANAGSGIAKTGAGYTLPGHLAEYMLIPEDVIAAKSMIKIEDPTIPFGHAAIAEPLSCCISAQEHHFHIETPDLTKRRVVERGVKHGGVLVVIGAGMMGRMNLDIALSSKPRLVIVSDFLPERLAIVEKLFAERAKKLSTELITSPPQQLSRLLADLTNSSGADDVIVAVGKQAAVESAQHLVGRGGVLDIFGGLPKAEDLVALRSGLIHYDEVTLVGSSGGIPWDIARAIELISTKEIAPEVHITRVCDLEDVPDILKLMQANQLDGKAITYPHIHLESQILTSTWTNEDEQRLIQQHQ